MKPSVTSENNEISLGQKESCITLITDATRKATGVAIDELIEAGTVNKKNLQKVLSRGHEVVAAVTLLVKEKIAEIAENISGCLKLISGAECLEIEATDGSETIDKARDVFTTGYIDSDFKNYGCNVAAHPTEKTSVQVYEMIKDGTFAEIFGGLSTDLNKLCLTQAQIIAFVKKHRKWLRTEGYATFFPFKVGDEVFVGSAGFDSGGHLGARVYRFDHDYVWNAEDRSRVVLPQLELEN